MFLCDSLPEGPSGDMKRNICSLSSSENMIVYSLWREIWEAFLNVHFKDWEIVYPTEEQEQHLGHAKLNEFQLLEANI